MANGHLKPIKVTVVGDGMVGKTCMLITYTSKEFPQEYVPTVFDNYADNIRVDGENFNMTLWDTAGQEDYERLRPLSYPNTDCFIICYSISSRASFENIGSKWFPEVQHFSPTIPIVLVGKSLTYKTDSSKKKSDDSYMEYMQEILLNPTKMDLRDSDTGTRKEPLITYVEGKRLKKRIKAVSFIECSALRQEGLQQVFIEAVRAVTKKKPVKSRPCTFV